ncbi:NADP-dependent 3-hydroxy acid dehydrogenase YdfG [Salinivirga cyanobacteriivorans]|uniref:NADP-dependent 3-hydroxy acid dehydrogenase YdfG n=1 Tax=Salinivirga cyanobacteriivorans TaxID=1307839 RepID=A0A0S2I323_9BACT|nr:SDR family oxidoreductase [Salinivirga cyanobacteriivorans]ALO16647.1 NADP-dependent 3-hydroxy acid dehydrogenase YdfG [Salinivirga cyanobacteriivorans]
MNKIALITGATAGIGEETAMQLAGEGYHVIITGRRKERLKKLAEQIKSSCNVEVLTLTFDIRSRAEVDEAIDNLPKEWQNIELLINNAGLAAGLKHLQEGDINDWEQMIDTNVKGLLYISRKIMPGMVARESGHIINVSSIAGKEVYEKGNVYCATKHAVEAITKGMRLDLLKHGIRVSSVSPGLVETEFSMVRFKGDEERAAAVYDGLEALRAEDIAETIVWIASRPPHVNINDVLITPTAQGNSTTTVRK